MDKEKKELFGNQTDAAVRALKEVLKFNNVPAMVCVSASIDLMAEFLQKMGVPNEMINNIGRSIAEAIKTAERLRDTKE